MGHPVDAVWGYTPRQIDGYLFLAGRRMKRRASLDLSVAAAGARGAPKEVTKQIKTWAKAEPGKS